MARIDKYSSNVDANELDILVETSDLSTPMETMARKDKYSFDVDEQAKKLKILIDTTDLSMPSECCIFRVPNILSHHNPRAFKPNAFPIGPFHHNKRHLKATKKIKLKYLQSLVSRPPTAEPDVMLVPDPDATLRRITQGIGEDLQSYHNCYAGPIDMGVEEFLRVLVLDGCFLVELLVRNKFSHLREENDPIFTMSCMFEFLYHDLILLENQIPWHVLDRVFKMTKDCLGFNVSLVELVIEFFKGDFSTGLARQSSRTDDLLKIEGKHILDFLRNTMVRHFPYEKDNTNHGSSSEVVLSATTLEEAGIGFKAASESSKSILNINFTKGVLEIPCLHVNENTEPLFRNLISFEQCLPKCEGLVTSYAVLMDKLINTSADMELLCKKKVIDNWLSTEDATKFFNQLYNDAYLDVFHYSKLENNINKYCDRHWPRYRRVLKHTYFKHPWAIISLAAGIFLLILTVLQTVFTIIK